MPKYNLSNPSVAEEERMIQDRIDEEYAMREAMDKAMRDAEEKAYWDSLEIKEE